MRTLKGPAIAVAVSAVVLTAVGTALWFVARHRESASVSASTAEAEFARIRSRFAQQPAFIDMAIRRPAAAAAPTIGAQPLRTFHTVVFDTRGGERLVRISVPYWFARRFARHNGDFAWLGELTFLDDTEFDPEPILLSLNQLEQRGPGLVVDYRHSGGGQFISWVE